MRKGLIVIYLFLMVSPGITANPNARIITADPLNPCPPNAVFLPSVPSQQMIQEVANIPEQSGGKNIANFLGPLMGECLLTKSGQDPILKYRPSPFDQTVLPHWKNKKIPDGINIPREKLLAIDSLARTLYGEMATCFYPKTPQEKAGKVNCGKEYFMAVAAIAVNRASYTDRINPARFASTTADPLKNSLTNVLSHKYQFSVWNPKKFDYSKHKPIQATNPSLKQVLCPPSDSKKSFYAGAKPSSAEQTIWKESLNIAMEAVLNPELFKAKTKEIKALHFTSGMGNFMKDKFNYSRYANPTPEILGKKINNDRCVQLWKAPEDKR